MGVNVLALVQVGYQVRVGMSVLVGVRVLVGEGPCVMVEVPVGVSVAGGVAEGSVVGARPGPGESVSEGTAVHVVGLPVFTAVIGKAGVMVGGSYRRAGVS